MMITSRATDYALLLLMHLAKLPPNETTSVKKVSEASNISIRFLANIANKLSIARIISSHRGVGGGIRLAKASNQISIREVIESVDGPIQTMFCQNATEDCSLESSCGMKFFWDDIQQTIVNKLEQTTIQNLISKTICVPQAKTTNQHSSFEVSAF